MSPIRGEKDNRQVHIAADELGLEFVTIQARHINIEQQAAGLART